LNGKEYPYTYLTHAEIIKGGNLVFEMGPEPSGWGKDISSRPQSKIDFPFVAVPYLTSGERVFKDSVKVGISSIQDSVKIYYTINGRDPRIIRKIYTSPLIIDKTSELKAVCYKNGVYSKVMISNFNRIPEGMSIKLNTAYSHQYSGGGAMGLIDGIKGTPNFHTDAWQGYEGNNLDAVINLGSVKNISSISTSFLQNTGSWIFYPAEIEYFVSADGKNFTKVYETKNKDDIKHSSPGVKDFSKKLEGIKAQYVRVFAKNVGVCPDWHVAAGGKAWLFVDEISVK
jgi:hypothetical protein